MRVREAEFRWNDGCQQGRAACCIPRQAYRQSLRVNGVAGVGVAHALGLDDGRTFRGAFPQRQFRALVPDLQRAQIVHEVPGLFGLDDVGKRRHGRAVQTGHEDFVEVTVRCTALEAVPRVKVVRPNRLVIAVGESICCRPIAAPFRTVAFPTFEFLVQSLAVLDAVEGEGRFGRHRDGLARFVGNPPGRERFDEGDQIGAVLRGERGPTGHVGGDKAPREGIVKVGVERQGARWRGTAFESGGDEIAWLRRDPRRVFAVAVAARSVAAPAIAVVEIAAGSGTAAEVTDVLFHGWRRLRRRFLGLLGRNRRRKDQCRCDIQANLCDLDVEHVHSPRTRSRARTSGCCWSSR